MRKIVSQSDRKHFLHLSMFVLFVYVAMFAISTAVAVINYLISKYVNLSVVVLKYTALALSTLHSFLIVVNWVAIKLQKGRLDYVKSSTYSWLISLLMDLLSTVSMVCNTVTSLINGGVLHTDSTWLLPLMSFLTMAISLFNFIFAIYFVLIAKKSVKNKETL